MATGTGNLVLRGATCQSLSGTDHHRPAAKGRVRCVSTAGWFRRGAARHAGVSRCDVGVDSVFFAAASSTLARCLWLAPNGIKPRLVSSGAGRDHLFARGCWLLQYVSIYTLTKIGWPPETETAVTVLTGAKAWWLRVYLGAFTVAIAPVAEEFIFRGMLYPLRQTMRLAAAGLVRRQLPVRPDSLECGGIRTAVPAGARVDVALRNDRQFARAHHGARAV